MRICKAPIDSPLVFRHVTAELLIVDPCIFYYYLALFVQSKFICNESFDAPLDRLDSIQFNSIRFDLVQVDRFLLFVQSYRFILFRAGQVYQYPNERVETCTRTLVHVASGGYSSGQRHAYSQ